MMGIYWPGHSWGSSSAFFSLIFWGGFIMIFYYVYLFCGILKLDGLAAFVAAKAGLLLLVSMMYGALLGVLSQEFTLL